MKKVSRWLLRAASIAILATVYSAAWLLSRVLKRRGQGSRQPSGCILAIGTFYNPNWIQSHIRREAVADGVTGFLVAPEDVATLERLLRKLLLDRMFGARIGAAARESVGPPAIRAGARSTAAGGGV